MKSGGWIQGQNPRSKQRSPFPLSSRAKPRDLRFYGPFLDTFLTERTVAERSVVYFRPLREIYCGSA